MDTPPIRVAVVGSGMAGLTTAYLLQRDHRYVVKVLESGNALSLDSASVSVPNAATPSTPSRVDLPMRAFAGGFYNNLKSMYDHLGVKYKTQPFLFEFATQAPRTAKRIKGKADVSSFVHASNFHCVSPRPSDLSTVYYIIEVVYLLGCYVWFTASCFLIEPRQGDTWARAETLEEYLHSIRLPAYFSTNYLLPLLSSVTTCPHKDLLAFPASDVTEYKRRTHGAPHFTVQNGVKAVQDKLVQGVDVVLSAVVSSVEPEEKGVRVSWTRNYSQQTETELFDRVVLAVAPDVVGNVFAPLQYHMKKIPTIIVESVVHTDRGHLPTELSEDSSQLIYLRTSTDGPNRTESLHVQPCGAVVTTCPFSPISASSVIHSAKFTRVLRTPESRRIVNSMFGDTPVVSDESKSVPLWRNGDDNVWLVGGWCWDGMVLLEGCVLSASRVADAFDVEVPWR